MFRLILCILKVDRIILNQNFLIKFIFNMSICTVFILIEFSKIKIIHHISCILSAISKTIVIKFIKKAVWIKGIIKKFYFIMFQNYLRFQVFNKRQNMVMYSKMALYIVWESQQYSHFEIFFLILIS